MSAEETKVYDLETHYAELEKTITAANLPVELGRVRAAFELADRSHAGQKRKDGTPYVSHCIAAAIITAELGLDEDAIIAAILHDCIEDTGLTYDDIARAFGAAVADIVEGVTKLTRVQYTSIEEQQVENLRKMLLAMAKDIRVILIKMADRLHNMRTMAYQSEEKQRIKSLETMEVYAPIAHRLGMQKMKWELEDLSLQYLDPAGYKAITDYLSERMDTLESFMSEIKGKLQTRLDAEGVQCTISSRIKHVYSIYRKMYAQKLDINGIFDLCAFRVIVDDISDCYGVLGIVHDMFKPMPGRFKDYISTPKPNNYRSVHTTVIGSEGIPFEVQIRTWEMHVTAEYGVAAHWKYKSGTTGVRPGDEEKFAWVRRLLETQQESDASDFLSNLKIDMFADEVFVFSPKGDVINLPAGATPIDFAYSIHSAIGNSMVGAKVNGRIVNFDHVLQNGDIVDIRTSKNAPGPSRDWLALAKSGSARTKIKQWLKKERREENVMNGREMFERELRANNIAPAYIMTDELLPLILKRLAFQHIDDLYAAIGYGGVTATRTVNRIKDELQRHQADGQKTAYDKITEQAERRNKRQRHAVHGVLVEGLDNCLIKFSRCCTPVPGDDIIGFITRGAGVSIHRKDCENYLNSPSENEGRWIAVGWADRITDEYTTTLMLVSTQRSALVMDVATVLNSLNAKVRTLTARDVEGNRSTATITVEVHSLNELRLIINRLSAIHGVYRVARVGSAAAKADFDRKE
ncbi:MAG: bifunctional (p)ppGpp synthetase/guanosine-3',5'-bis(diphosphate) 3'-pyrophosphohydrolase [Oscillospiraceae bacterium]|nr:bifunctional (p)ppGpp synthetase/guanosine-3',5'-bis(diphosphate) 3'-pyrophosphohydrolase [Oscillospiraceae bacterium]